jgi:energy-coupling factor transporter ATP-binding protein EcfA2
MYVDKVILKNIRGFENLEFSLRRGDGSYAGWTVFTGDNGAGKSTLLKAIAIALVKIDVAFSLQPSFKRWIREAADVTEAQINLTILLDKANDNAPGLNWDTTIQIAYSNIITLQKPSTGVTGNFSSESGVSFLRDFRDILDQPVHPLPGWFACGYGPFRRVFGASPEATRLMTSPDTERFVTMFQEAASLFEVDQWLRKLNHKALEGKTDEKAQLELLLEILRDDLMPNQITVDRVDSDGLWLKDRNGLQLAWGDMSDGYRSAVALLADILRHLINCYGMDGLDGRDADGKLFIRRGGVVLIDEIDAHLHPEWQREIGFWLKGHFPNIQFLVTTHSPIICQAADDNGLFVLPEPGSDDQPRALTHAEYETVIASRPDTILLTPAFGLQNTRSPRAVKGRADYAKLQAKKRAGSKLSEDENNQLQQLQLFADTDEEA